MSGWVLAALVGAFLFVGGATLVVSGVRQGRAWRRFVARSHVVPAVVTDLRVRRTRSGQRGTRTYWVPVVRFALPDGRWVEAETLYGANPPPAQPGAHVQVRFDPDEPTRVNLDRGLASGGTMSGIMIGVGIFVGLAGSAVLVGTLVVRAVFDL